MILVINLYDIRKTVLMTEVAKQEALPLSETVLDETFYFVEVFVLVIQNIKQSKEINIIKYESKYSRNRVIENETIYLKYANIYIMCIFPIL